MQHQQHKVPVDLLAASLGVPASSLKPLGIPGGQGEVWALVHGARAEAVKVFFGQTEPHRIPAEVEALGRVRNQNVVGFVGQDIVRVGNDAFPCLRYELVHGISLHQALASGLPTPDNLKALGTGLFDGLVAIHQQHLVHRDLKPMNIVLRNGDWGMPVIIDFGLVRLIDTATNTIYPWARGTWPFMAPEQLMGQRAYERADVFAAGLILYMSKAGSHPFLAPQEFRQQPPVDYLQRLGAGANTAGFDTAAARFFRSTICAQPVSRASTQQAAHFWTLLP